MVTYKNVKIGALGKIVTGKTPPTSNSANYSSEYMFLGPADLHKQFIIRESEKTISQQGLQSIKGSILNGLSILVGCIGWDMGNVGLVQEKCATNQQINSITEIKSDFNPYYIYYWLFHKKQFLFQKANVTRTPILNKTDFSNIEIPIPNKTYQDKVARFLSSLDSKIELNNRINSELEAMAKTLYDYWFVQFDFPNEHGKPYKSSGGKMVYNKELKREIPEGWEVKTVGQLLHKYTDKSVRIDSKSILKKGKYPVITQDNGDFIAGFTNEENPIEDTPLIIFGDHSCTLRYVDFSFFRGADGTQVMSFSQNLTIYIYSFLQKVINQITGYGKYERHFKYLKDFKVVVPELKHLENFQLKIKPIFDKISHARFENQQLASLRDCLLPMLMNGQVTVRQAHGSAIKEAEAKLDTLDMAAEPSVAYKK